VTSYGADAGQPEEVPSTAPPSGVGCGNRCLGARSHARPSSCCHVHVCVRGYFPPPPLDCPGAWPCVRLHCAIPPPVTPRAFPISGSAGAPTRSGKWPGPQGPRMARFVGGQMTAASDARGENACCGECAPWHGQVIRCQRLGRARERDRAGSTGSAGRSRAGTRLGDCFIGVLLRGFLLCDTSDCGSRCI
jgi:hypothetical protein